jgi:hypothetical protein
MLKPLPELPDGIPIPGVPDGIPLPELGLF